MKLADCKRRVELKRKANTNTWRREEEVKQHRNYTFICVPKFQHQRSMLIEKEVMVMSC